MPIKRFNPYERLTQLNYSNEAVSSSLNIYIMMQKMIEQM